MSEMTDDRFTEKARELLASLGYKAGHDRNWNMEKCVQFWAQALREEAERVEPVTDVMLLKLRDTLHPFNTETNMLSLTKTVKAMANEIYELRKIPKPQVVSEEELRQIVIEWATKQDPTLITLQPESYFLQGFREAMRRNAVAEIEKLWPSEEEFTEAFNIELSRIEFRVKPIEVHVQMVIWAYRWLRERIGIK